MKRVMCKYVVLVAHPSSLCREKASYVPRNGIYEVEIRSILLSY